MNVIDRGYIYELRNFEDKEKNQTLRFICKAAAAGTRELQTISDGTTNEEVLEVLIDRLRFLHKKLPSRESALALTRVEEALLWLNHRTDERRARGVEGSNEP